MGDRGTRSGPTPEMSPTARALLDQVVATILARTKPAMILLYGSRARGDFKPDSDLDIAVVVMNPKRINDSLWYDVVDRANEIADPIPVSIEVFTLDEIVRGLARGNSFFRDVVSDAVVLMNAGGLVLEVPPMTPLMRVWLAEDAIAYELAQAREWIAAARRSPLEDQLDRTIAVRDLHRAVEAVYRCVLAVFDGYVPNFKDLAALEARAVRVCPGLTAPAVPADVAGGVMLDVVPLIECVERWCADVERMCGARRAALAGEADRTASAAGMGARHDG